MIKKQNNKTTTFQSYYSLILSFVFIFYYLSLVFFLSVMSFLFLTDAHRTLTYSQSMFRFFVMFFPCIKMTGTYIKQNQSLLL